MFSVTDDDDSFAIILLGFFVTVFIEVFYIGVDMISSGYSFLLFFLCCFLLIVFVLFEIRDSFFNYNYKYFKVSDVGLDDVFVISIYMIIVFVFVLVYHYFFNDFLILVLFGFHILYICFLVIFNNVYVRVEKDGLYLSKYGQFIRFEDIENLEVDGNTVFIHTYDSDNAIFVNISNKSEFIDDVRCGFVSSRFYS
jgi:hypothetical protein